MISGLCLFQRLPLLLVINSLAALRLVRDEVASLHEQSLMKTLQAKRPDIRRMVLIFPYLYLACDDAARHSDGILDPKTGPGASRSLHGNSCCCCVMRVFEAGSLTRY